GRRIRSPLGGWGDGTTYVTGSGADAQRWLGRGPAVERAIVNRFAHVGGLEGGRAVQVRDGAGDLEHPVVGAGGEAQTGDGSLEQRIGAVGNPAVGAQVARRHVGVGVD